MCYLIAKNKNAHGCYALKTRHGKHLAEMKKRMNQQVAEKGIQLVTISRPTAYGEYAPYTFVNDENEFENVVKICWLPLRFDVDMVYIDWKDSWSLDEYEDVVR